MCSYNTCFQQCFCSQHNVETTMKAVISLHFLEMNLIDATIDTININTIPEICYIILFFFLNETCSQSGRQFNQLFWLALLIECLQHIDIENSNRPIEIAPLRTNPFYNNLHCE